MLEEVGGGANSRGYKADGEVVMYVCVSVCVRMKSTFIFL